MPPKTNTTGTQSRYWLVTINNPRDYRMIELWPGITYAAWQHEKGEEGTDHIQGYIVFDKKTRLSALKKLDHGRGHWEVRRGTHAEAKTYCTKEESRVEGPWFLGTDANVKEKAQGKRSDLDAVKAAIDEGRDEGYLVENYFGDCAKYFKFFQQYKRMKTNQRTFKTEVIVIYGPTGTGKSHHCSVTFPGAYWKPKGDWWDGYDGHKVVVIDEFYGWLAYDFMLRLLDCYPLIVPTKGSFASFVAKTIVITSNKHPRDWYNETKFPFPPLERRITKLIHMDQPYVSTIPTTTTTTTSSEEFSTTTSATTTSTIPISVSDSQDLPATPIVVTEGVEDDEERAFWSMVDPHHKRGLG